MGGVQPGTSSAVGAHTGPCNRHGNCWLILGTAVTISSMYALLAAVSRLLMPQQGGIVQLTKSLAEAWAADNIRATRPQDGSKPITGQN